MIRKKLIILDKIKPKLPFEVYTKYIAEDECGRLYQGYDVFTNKFKVDQVVYHYPSPLIRWFMNADYWENTMQNLTWLIEEFDADENCEKIAQAVQDQGMEAHITKYAIYHDLNSIIPNKENVLCVGTISLMRQLNKVPWIPGCFANFKNFDCSNYYSYYGKYMSNNDYIILPLAEFDRRADTIREMFNTKFLFVRPCNGFKTFGGHVVYEQKDIDYLTQKYPANLLVLISSKKILNSEYRVFVAGNKIITGSKYKSGVNVDYSQMYDPELIEKEFTQEAETQKSVYDFINKVLKEVKYRPDPIFAIDVGMHDVIGPRILELSSFSSSGWYESDINKMVKVGSELAMKEISEVQV